MGRAAVNVHVYAVYRTVNEVRRPHERNATFQMFYDQNIEYDEKNFDNDDTITIGECNTEYKSSK